MDYTAHLVKDRKLRKVVGTQDPIRLTRRQHIHLRLCGSIMSQQLSTKVATVIHNRFLALYSGKNPSAEQILATPFDVLRSIGLSNAKAGYVQNVAKFAIEKGIDAKRLNKMNNEEVIAYLTEIKGVGRWTVEMILMFTLGREDVFAVDDLGIQNAMIKLYGLDRTDKKKFREDMLSISQKMESLSNLCLHSFMAVERC